MKRCTALRPSSFTTTISLTRRWASYDKSLLTNDALQEKLEHGLGKDTGSEHLKIDAASKTIQTAAGALPISPLFDPAWMKARRRQKKDAPGPPTGRFRLKLANNPFARALATPIRRCANTNTCLPRYFLQDFELVQHPSTGAAWWAPGPLAFDHVQPTKRSDSVDASDNLANEQQSAITTSATEATPTFAEAENTTESAGATSSSQPSSRRAPITSYTVCRKSMVDKLGGPNRKYVALLLAVRNGMAIKANSRNAVWRSDMGDVVLQMMRRQVVDALISRGNRTWGSKQRFIQPCASWDAVKDVHLRGCVLWLPEKQDADRQYATLDVEGVSYGGKMAVHNLHWLLGVEETQRLKEGAEMFQKHEILVLKQWTSISMTRLHMLLWRMQGYLAEPKEQ